MENEAPKETGQSMEQLSEGTPEETTQVDGLDAADGQSEDQVDERTTDAGPSTDAEAFFDPSDLPDELRPAYKNMQKAFTKKMQGIKDHRQKIEAYDAFMTDPVGQLQTMARQYGYQLTRAEAQQMVQDQQAAGGQQPSQGQGQEPQTWEDVYRIAEERATQKVLQQISPYLSQVQDMRKNTMETFLDDNCPDWRVYEDDMMGNLRQHPSLVNNPEALYRMSVPPEVLESRATQKALKKLQTKSQSAKVGGKSSVKAGKVEIPDGPMSFAESVEWAKRKLEQDGIRPPK